MAPVFKIGTWYLTNTIAKPEVEALIPGTFYLTTERRCIDYACIYFSRLVHIYLFLNCNEFVCACRRRFFVTTDLIRQNSNLNSRIHHRTRLCFRHFLCYFNGGENLMTFHYRRFYSGNYSTR